MPCRYRHDCPSARRPYVPRILHKIEIEDTAPVYHKRGAAALPSGTNYNQPSVTLGFGDWRCTKRKYLHT